MKIIAKTGALLRMVKIEHSVFALPFAYSGAFLAAGGWPGWYPLVWLTVAMVAVRSFAMAFNRLTDLRYDSLNPRTQDRPLVSGALSVPETGVFLVVTALIFVGACKMMNLLAFELAGVALFWSGFYSYTKRFTSLCHYFLGSVLGLAPLAGWISVSPEITLPGVLLGLGVTFWVAGFDILYACQDDEFDRSQGLFSLPARFGHDGAMFVAAFSHVITSIFFGLAGWAAGLNWVYFAGWAVITIILVAEHRIIGPDKLDRINMAFFTFNGVISFLVLGSVLGALYL